MNGVTCNEKGELIDSETGNVVTDKNTIVALEPTLLTSVGRKVSKYEITLETFFTITFGLVFFENRIIIINESDVENVKDSENHWVKFRMWNYAEEIQWKNDCMELNNNTRGFVLNEAKLDELKVRNLLLDWSFSEADNNLKLLHVNGVLSDEGIKLFYNLQPNLIRHIKNQMNNVLELNG